MVGIAGLRSGTWRSREGRGLNRKAKKPHLGDRLEVAMSLDRMNFRLSLDRARLEVLVELLKNGDPIGGAVMDASSLERMIHQFADIRAQMADPVPERLDHRSVVSGRKDINWQVQRNSDGNVDLLLRHRGLGWLGFHFPKEDAERMAKVMSAQRGDAALE